MNEEIVDKNGNINISLENTMRLLKENDNSKVDEYFFAVYDFLETITNENSALQAENKTLKATVEIIKETIKYLTRKYKDKGE